MKTKTIIGLILLMSILVGCSTREVIYQNQTTERVIEKSCDPCIECQEIDIPDCICNFKEPECKTDIKTVIVDQCTQKLNLCHLRYDNLNDYLFECLTSNSTSYADNLTEELELCITDKDLLQDKIDKINNIT